MTLPIDAHVRVSRSRVLARMATTGIYLLRGLPSDLQRAARVRAQSEGTTLCQVLLQGLREYAAGTWTPKSDDTLHEVGTYAGDLAGLRRARPGGDRGHRPRRQRQADLQLTPVTGGSRNPSSVFRSTGSMAISTKASVRQTSPGQAAAGREAEARKTQRQKAMSVAAGETRNARQVAKTRASAIQAHSRARGQRRQAKRDSR
jgi:hypothetical protein